MNYRMSQPQNERVPDFNQLKLSVAVTVEMSNLGKRQCDFKLKGFLLGYLCGTCAAAVPWLLFSVLGKSEPSSEQCHGAVVVIVK